MNYDENMSCPVCKAKLFTDEVAYCPECGAPHHKQCYLSIGHCAYADTHGTENQWQPPKIAPPEPTENAVDNEAKTVAGAPKFEGEFNNSRKERENPFFEANGIDKNEDIGGISAESIAKFVGYNALRYLNIFREMANFKKKINWNWIAFLVPEYWLVSRKCYFQAILVSLYSVLFSVFYSTGTANSNIKNFLATGAINPDVEKIVLVLFIGSVISLCIKLFMGMFGDYIYKKKVYSTIEQMKNEGSISEIDYIKKGGVNLVLPMLLYFGVNMLSLVIISFI